MNIFNTSNEIVSQPTSTSDSSSSGLGQILDIKG
jgi:hypothetical protein